MLNNSHVIQQHHGFLLIICLFLLPDSKQFNFYIFSCRAKGIFWFAIKTTTAGNQFYNLNKSHGSHSNLN